MTKFDGRRGKREKGMNQKKNPYADLLGIQIIEVGKGRLTFQQKWKPGMQTGSDLRTEGLFIVSQMLFLN